MGERSRQQSRFLAESDCRAGLLRAGEVVSCRPGSSFPFSRASLMEAVLPSGFRWRKEPSLFLSHRALLGCARPEERLSGCAPGVRAVINKRPLTRSYALRLVRKWRTSLGTPERTSLIRPRWHRRPSDVSVSRGVTEMLRLSPDVVRAAGRLA